jgi:hypothetical protein
MTDLRTSSLVFVWWRKVMDRLFTPFMHFLSQFLKKLPSIYVYIYMYIYLFIHIFIYIYCLFETRLLYWNIALHDKRSLLMMFLLLF